MRLSDLPPSGLLDRETERQALDGLVAGLAEPRARPRGEAGVGKSALLEHLAASADGCPIARAASCR